jgi:hypothetical protein
MSAESANATSQAAQHKVHPHQDNQQLLAYQRKYDEEYEGFKKLAAKLQASVGQQGSMLGKHPAATSQSLWLACSAISCPATSQLACCTQAPEGCKKGVAYCNAPWAACGRVTQCAVRVWLVRWHKYRDHTAFATTLSPHLLLLPIQQGRLQRVERSYLTVYSAAVLSSNCSP